MTEPKRLSIKDFGYDLPAEKIAYYPLPNRDASKLLIYNKGNINTDVYRNIAQHIPKDSLIVFNNTKVVEARLRFKKETGGVIEIFCLAPHESYRDVTLAMSEVGTVKWLCLIGGASKWKNGMVLKNTFQSNAGETILEAHYIEKRNDCFVIELKWNNTLSFAEVLHHAGNIPLPPYIKREATPNDAERYQTVYARFDGSVAAPTAGLHFTQEVLRTLEQKSIRKQYVTLHVGAGTFQPVKADFMEGHEMHSEFIEASVPCIEALIQNHNKPCIAVGTTSLRTLESLYWIGKKLLVNPNAFKNTMPFLEQWDPYVPVDAGHKAIDCLQAILDYLKTNKTEKLVAKTQIMIAPGYRFKMVDGLVTNFHQPASTLLLLVSAFIGDDWKAVYNYALQNEFRFLSYGDGSLLWRT